MSNKILLTIAALVIGLPGLFLFFAPEEILGSLGWSAEPSAALFAQITGTLACAIGLNNWMARGATIGGIYGRPLLLLNLFAFFSAGLSLLKASFTLNTHVPLLVVGVIWLLCGLAFGRLLFVPPKA